MRHLLEGKSQSPESSWYTSTSAYTVTKMGRHKHGLYLKAAEHLSKAWFHMGYCWQTHEISTFHSGTYYLHSQEMCRDLPQSHYLPAWCTQDNHFWSWYTVCCTLLGTVASISWDQIDSKLSLSPPNRWTDWEGEPNRGGHVESLCHSLWQELRQMPSSSGVLIQQ